jgi:hypothetical protein
MVVLWVSCGPSYTFPLRAHPCVPITTISVPSCLFFTHALFSFA